MTNTNFIAIDFETATFNRMACQIGIVVVENGVITERISKLIQPPGNKYDTSTIAIHGITPDKTSNKPTFDIVWKEIEKYFIGRTIVAHNAQFDEDVFYRNLEYYNIFCLGINKFKCTCNIFNRIGLQSLCEAFKMDYKDHHDALFDAECCAIFYLKYLNGEEPNISLITNKTNNPKKKSIYHEKLTGDILKKDLNNADPQNPFYNKTIVITGTFNQKRIEIGNVLKSMGADINSSISKNTNYILIGKDAGYVKLDKVDKLIHDGFNIKKLYQEDYDRIISKDWNNYNIDNPNVKNLDFTIEHFEKHRLHFKKYNIIASKELFYGKGLSGDRHIFMQICGNLGAFGDNEIYPKTDICVLSNSTIDKLSNGEKDETILYIQNYYNNSKSILFEFSFLTEGDILAFCKNRCYACGDELTLELYNKYINL